MSRALKVPVCPPGFDCAFLNSCPQYFIDCPDGYFCDSYQGFDNQGQMDFQFAMYRERNNLDVDVSQKNKELYIDMNRAIQVKCLFGFFCSTSSEMKVCPVGHWCPESTVEPNKCDTLSVCAEGVGYQVNFMSTLIMVLMSVFIFTSSLLMVSRQKKRNNKSHLKDPSALSEEMSSVTGNSRYDSIDNKQRSYIEVTFRDLQFQVAVPRRKGQRTNAHATRDILPRIDGTVPAGKLSVVLGPTACGKSTLLNMIRTGGHNARSGVVNVSLVSGGTDSVSNRALTRSELSQYIGYVPQDDILDRDLTIRELLTFNTLARLPHISSVSEADPIVNSVLSDLAIQHVADSIIGGGENKPANISGGQLKRVNIAVELVALNSPGLLLLDEPTAGLDAAIAYDLVQSLETIMIHKGITILAVLQQPRAEILNKIDGSLFLMDVDGNIVYEGPAGEVVSYLQSIGYVKPSSDTAAADFCIDVLNGLADRLDNSVVNVQDVVTQLGSGDLDRLSQKNSSDAGSSSKKLGHRQNRVGSVASADEFNLLAAWQQRCITTKSIEDGHNQDLVSATVTQRAEEQNSAVSSPKLSASVRFLRLSLLNGQRLLTIRLRNTFSLLTYFGINCIMAIALSSGFSILLRDSYLKVFSPPTKVSLQEFFPSPLSEYSGWNEESFNFTQLLFFMAGALGCASCLTAVPVFSGQLALIKRERAAGMSVVAYTFGRIVADLLFVVFNAMVYTGTWMLFGHAGHWYNWIATTVCTAFAASAIGYITGAAARANDASVFAIILSFVCSVFSGSEPTLSDVNKYPIVNWPWYLSYATWTSEATYVTWSSYLSNDGLVEENLQQGADHYGYEVENGLGRSIGALIALGIGLRVIAGVILYYKTR